MKTSKSPAEAGDSNVAGLADGPLLLLASCFCLEFTCHKVQIEPDGRRRQAFGVRHIPKQAPGQVFGSIGVLACHLLRQRVYRHERVMSVMRDAEEVTRRIFRHYMSDPVAMPEVWRGGAGDDPVRRARRTADFVASMTDRFALAEYRRLFGTPPELR